MQGKHRPLDILSVRQEGRETLYSHLLAMWGLIADIDIESERFRWAGRLRFDLSGVARVMNLRKYRARLTYLPASQAPPSEPVQATDKTPPIRFQDGTVHNGPPAGWQVSFEFCFLEGGGGLQSLGFDQQHNRTAAVLACLGGRRPVCLHCCHEHPVAGEGLLHGPVQVCEEGVEVNSFGGLAPV